MTHPPAMLISMTGHGEARRHENGVMLAVEVRSVNHRHLKLTVRGPDWVQAREVEVERVARRFVKRGSVNVNIDIRFDRDLAPGRINVDVLDAYVEQLGTRVERLGHGRLDPSLVAALLTLPGVTTTEAGDSVDHSAIWPQVEAILDEAMNNLMTMRRSEGMAMRREFVLGRERLIAEVRAISERAPRIVESHAERLTQKVQQALAHAGLDPHHSRGDVVREVALLSEKLDIAEELVRLNCHFDQFLALLDEADCPGRKLDFLLQEMLRETNTIGSKSADVEVARRVVNIKSILEQVRELVQNVE